MSFVLFTVAIYQNKFMEKNVYTERINSNSTKLLFTKNYNNIKLKAYRLYIFKQLF